MHFTHIFPRFLNILKVLRFVLRPLPQNIRQWREILFRLCKNNLFIGRKKSTHENLLLLAPHSHEIEVGVSAATEVFLEGVELVAKSIEF